MISMHRLMIAMAVLCAAAGCAREASEPAGDILHAGNRSEVQDLDPHLVTGIAEHRAMTALFEGLVALDPATMQPVPAAAERWTVSGDGLRYQFFLRENARWSNGEPLTAHDFVYAWKRILTPALASEYAYLLHCLRNGKAYNNGVITDFNEVGVKAPEEHLLEVTLEHPTPYFLSMQIHYAWFPVHQGTIEKYGAFDQRGSEWSRTGNHVGNGPFKLSEWVPDEVVKTVRNEHYWDAQNVRLDGVYLYPISNEQTEERSFRAGELQLTYSVPLHRIEVYQREQPEALVLAPYLQSYFYRFNVARPPFDDVRVRRAFGMAIDREELVTNVLKGGEQPAYFLTPPDTAGYTCTTRVAAGVEAARALLAEAGYPGGEGLPAIEILYNTSEADKLIAQTIQRMWQENLGARVDLVNQDYKVYLDSMSALNYSVARSTWLGDVMDPVNFLECFLRGEGNNRTGWGSPEYDAEIQASYHEADAEARLQHLQRAEAILLNEAPITPVFFQTQKFLRSPSLKNLQPNLLGYIRWQHLYFERTDR